jgi:hypothetical protein
VSKFGPFPSTKKQWEWKLSSAKELPDEDHKRFVSSVAFYKDQVYVAILGSPKLFILNKDSGAEVIYKRPDGTLVDRLTVVGSAKGSAASKEDVVGGLHIVAGKIYWTSGSGGRIYRHDLQTGIYDDVTFSLGGAFTAFNGRDICANHVCKKVLHHNIWSDLLDAENGLKRTKIDYHYVGREGGDVGGTGTVFIEDKRLIEETQQTVWYSRLYLDNQHTMPPLKLLLDTANPRRAADNTKEPNEASYGFWEVSLMGGAELELKKDVNRDSVSLQTVYSDGLNYMHVEKDQHWYVEYADGSLRHGRPWVNFVVHEKGTLWLVDQLDIHGDLEVALDWRGLLAGPHTVHVKENRGVKMSATATSSLIVSGTIKDSSPVPGHISFAHLRLESDAIWLNNEDTTLECGRVEFLASAHMAADSFNASIASFFLEGGAELVTSGRGPKAGEGDGKGGSLESEEDGIDFGTGGGHGGYGGGDFNSTSEHDPVHGGDAYGSYTLPSHYGSGGGGPSTNTTCGGRGGSFMHLVIGEDLHLDGLLENRGVMPLTPTVVAGLGEPSGLKQLNSTAMARLM